MRSLLKGFFLSLIIGVLTACTISSNPIYTGSSLGGGNSTATNTPIPRTLGNTTQRNLSFPYEFVPDTFTALTCPSKLTINNRHFTLTAGAYFNHGLQLSEAFKKEHNIQEDTPEQKVRQLLESSPFKRAQAFLSIRDESNLNSIFKSSTDIKSPFPFFHNPSSLDLLSKQLAVFTSRSADNRNAQLGGNFSTSLPLYGPSLISLAPGLAENSFGQPLIALSYEINNKPFLSENKQLYGRGYKLKFGDPFRANYLTQIKEEDLATTEEQGSWECPSNLRFMIHRATSKESSPFNSSYETYEGAIEEHIRGGISGEGYCNTNNKSLNSAEKYFFELIFGTTDLRALPFEIGKTVIIEKEDLDSEPEEVQTEQVCIKLKRASCYSNQGFYRIQFDSRKIRDCVPISEITTNGYTYRNEKYYEICPAFLSACYRRR